MSDNDPHIFIGGTIREATFHAREFAAANGLDSLPKCLNIRDAWQSLVGLRGFVVHFVGIFNIPQFSVFLAELRELIHLRDGTIAPFDKLKFPA